MTDAEWLPADWHHPLREQLTDDVHLRPIRAEDVDIDMVAVMANQPALWEQYGEAWGWPPATMTYEADREDLARHEREIAEHVTFNYAVLDADETRLVGCVYVDPHDDDAVDAESSWWVVDELAGSTLERELDAFVPRWLTTTWGFGRVEYPFNAVG